MGSMTPNLKVLCIAVPWPMTLLVVQPGARQSGYGSARVDEDQPVAKTRTSAARQLLSGDSLRV